MNCADGGCSVHYDEEDEDDKDYDDGDRDDAGGGGGGGGDGDDDGGVGGQESCVIASRHQRPQIIGPPHFLPPVHYDQ